MDSMETPIRKAYSAPIKNNLYRSVGLTNQAPIKNNYSAVGLTNQAKKTKLPFVNRKLLCCLKIEIKPGVYKMLPIHEVDLFNDRRMM